MITFDQILPVVIDVFRQHKAGLAAIAARKGSSLAIKQVIPTLDGRNAALKCVIARLDPFSGVTPFLVLFCDPLFCDHFSAVTLDGLAASGAFTDIADPVAWQREQRQDRVGANSFAFTPPLGE